MEIKDYIIYNRTVPARKAQYADFPVSLNPELQEYLREHGINQLYCHQAEMFEQAMQRHNIVITTSTASGKTLSFILPVLQDILDNPLTRAIFIYPTKALASDQFRAIKPYLDYFGEGRISAGVYDGDTPVNERSRIRKSANIILTNPEMINGAFLPNHSKYGFDFIFANLRYVVIDELHTYRGIFGSHVANVFRRLGRVCRYYNSDPQFLCSSATIANPEELASEVCGKEFIRIAKDGSPAAKRTYSLVQPPKIEGRDNEYYGQIQATSIAAQMIPELVEENHSFITFAKSRRNVEVVLREARDKLDAESFMGTSLANRISGYRGGYTPIERKEIESKMITGALKGLVSTNALELGIDIGKVDTTILVGFPGTRASFWQQTGRAGRSGMNCHNYMILESLPFDQYIGVNPDWLFESASENAVIDKNNLLIELCHIRAAAAEIPLTLNDISVFPDLGETIPILLRVNELNSQNGKFAWAGNAFPAGDYSLRNMDKNRYKLMNQEITEMDEMQTFRELHDGAIYMHDGMQYQVLKLDLESKTAFAIPFKGDYYTMPGGTTEVKIIKQHQEQDYGRIHSCFGDVNVNDIVFMYKKLQFHNHQNLGFEQLRTPLSKKYDTESTWIRIPDNVVTVYRRLLQVNQSGQMIRNNHFDGLCFAIKNATRMATMTEEEDIGVTMSTNAIGLKFDGDDASDNEVHMFIYDKFVGGMGYAEKAYNLLPQIIDHAIKMVGGCSCKNGCAACVGDYKLDKSVVLWGLKSLLEELEAPQNQKYVEYAERAVTKKQFQFEDLPVIWDQFLEYLKNTGESLSTFLYTVPYVTIEDRVLTLYTNSEFYKQWIMESSNYRSLINILSFYTEAPEGIRISVVVIDEDKEQTMNLKNKLKKRYENLME